MPQPSHRQIKLSRRLPLSEARDGLRSSSRAARVMHDDEPLFGQHGRTGRARRWPTSSEERNLRPRVGGSRTRGCCGRSSGCEPPLLGGDPVTGDGSCSRPGVRARPRGGPEGGPMPQAATALVRMGGSGFLGTRNGLLAAPETRSGWRFGRGLLKGLLAMSCRERPDKRPLRAASLVASRFRHGWVPVGPAGTALRAGEQVAGGGLPRNGCDLSRGAPLEAVVGASGGAAGDAGGGG